MPLELTTRSVAGSSVIGCSGRIVLGEESAKLRHVVKEALAECNHIVLDLGGVSHIDSTGVGVLVGLHAPARQAGGGMKLANLNARLRDLVRITRLLTIFEVFDTRSEERR